MTAMEEVEEKPIEGATSTNENTENASSPSAVSETVTLKNDIINFLCQNQEIHFKSLQIDDPELTIDEKKEIANEILSKNHATFLTRFGHYLKSEHLKYFDRNDEKNDNNGMNIDNNENNTIKEDEEKVEVEILLKNLRKNLNQKYLNIKNRRYAAMQALIRENNYFSEKEMMRREPYLYEQLVGQYLTESEKRIRDSYDTKTTTFSNIILDTFDKEQMNELRKKQEHDEEEQEMLLFDDTLSLNSTRTSEFDTPPSTSFYKQWGNFDNESENSNDKYEPSSSNKNKERKRIKKLQQNKQEQNKFITAGEREMLRQEFVGIMYSKFLEGEDKDFDYSQVDNNTDLDDLKQIGQDDEDEYFDKSDDDDLDKTVHRNIHRMDDDDDDMKSEDELDKYMKHLKKHPALKKRENDEEEEEEEDD